MNDSPAPAPPPDDQDTTSRLGKIARGGVLMLGGAGFEAVVGYAVMIVAARLLGKHDFGIFSLGVSAIGLNVILYELGLPTAVMRYVAVYDGEGDSARAKGTALGGTAFCGSVALVGGMALAALAGPISDRIFHKPDLARILPIMAIQLPAVCVMATLLRVTQARGTMRYRVLVEKITLPVTRMLFIGVLLAVGFGLAGAAWGATLSALGGLAVASYFAARIMRRAWGSTSPRWEIPRLISYAAPLLLSALALFARRRGITLALGVRGTAGQVGVYAAAERTALAGAMGLRAMGSIFAPVAADLHNRNEHDELHRILKAGAAWIIMVVMPISLFLILCAPEVMAAFGKGFPEGYIALIILAGARLTSCTFGSVDVVLAMCAKQWVALVDLAFFAATSIGLALYLVPRMGIIGAAIAGAVGVLGPRITRVIEVAVLMRMNPFGLGHIRAAACVIPSVAFVLIWRRVFAGALPEVVFLPIVLPIYFLLYAAMLPVAARPELHSFLTVIRRRRGRAARRHGAQPGEPEAPPPSLSDPDDNGQVD